MFEINNKTLKLCRNYDLSLRYFMILWHDIKSRFFNSLLLIDDTSFVCLIHLFEEYKEYLFTLVYFGYNVRLSEIRRRSGQGKWNWKRTLNVSMFRIKKGETNTEFLFFKWYLNFISLWKLKLKCYIEMRNKLNCTLRLKFYL